MIAFVGPKTADEVAWIVRETAPERYAIAPIGAGTMPRLGNPPEREGIALQMRGLNRIIEYAPEDQVAVVEAGVTLGEMQTELARHGQRLAIDPPAGEEMTIGGMIATNAYGPSALRYGTLKDLIVGIEVVRADGAVARAGGKVVKNVAGFDISKLMVGALGTLAIVTKATFRLHPLPESTRTLRLVAPSSQVFPFVLAMREAQLEPSAVVARVRGAEAMVDVTFEGFGPGVDAQCAVCEKVARGTGPSTTLGTGSVDGRGYMLKATFPPSEFARVAGLMEEGIAYPSLGVMFSTGLVPSVVEGLVPSVVEGLRVTLEELGGTLVIQDMPDEWRGKIDAWGTPPPAFKIMQALKRRFDPERRLNPGRFVGGL